MKKYIVNFTNYLHDALTLSFQINPVFPEKMITNVIITGMGESFTSGKMVREIVINECKVSVQVINDYFMPEFINENTLVIISSYCGNAEEALLAYIQAQQKKSEIVCITSGGQLAGLARENSTGLILLPDELPSCFSIGYNVIAMLKVMHSFRLISGQFEEHCRSSVRLLDLESENIQLDAKNTASLIRDKICVIYSLSLTESAAIHFRQQLNELSKSLAWNNVFPELNHNEIKGWQRKQEDLFLILFRNENDFIRTSKRLDTTREIIKVFSSGVKEVFSKGISRLEQLFYLVNWSDWTTYHATKIKDINSRQKGKEELSPAKFL